MRLCVTTFLGLVSLLGTAYSAYAATTPYTTPYTNRESFAVATGNLTITTISFDGILGSGVGFEDFNPLLMSGISFSTPKSSSAFVNVTNPSFYAPDDYPAPFIVDSINPNLTNTIVIAFKGTTAIGLDFGSLGSAAVGTITLSNRYVFPLSSLPSVGNTTFLGFVSTDALTTLTLQIKNDSWVVQDIVLGVSDQPTCSIIPPTGYRSYLQYQPDGTNYEVGVSDTFGISPGSCLTRQYGCLLTSAATMLTTFDIWTTGFVPSPSWLDAQLKSSLVKGYSVDGNLDCETNRQKIVDVVQTAAEATKGKVDIFSGDQICQGSSDCSPTDSSIDSYLENHVCSRKDRVIVALNLFRSDGTSDGTHFALVTGKSEQSTSNGGTEWTVLDPGFSAISRLSDYARPFDGGLTARVASATSYYSTPVTRNPASLSVVANSPVELLLKDPEGQLLGRSEANQTTLLEVPGGSYFRDFPLSDDAGSGVTMGDPTGRKIVYVSGPPVGTYEISTTGTGLGTYTLSFEAVADDGTIQSSTLMGITAPGLSSSRQISYSATPGSPLTVKRIVTYRTTLDDIKTGVQLDLIAREAAHILSETIEAASREAHEGKTEIARDLLKIFEQEVRIGNSRYIKSTVEPILFEDADELLHNLRSNESRH